jgi:hypothetical protein
VTANDILGLKVPDSAMAREVAQLIRDTEGDLLFNHSVRVYLWAGLMGRRKGLMFDPELLYTAAMFHDIGVGRGYEQFTRTERDAVTSAYPRGEHFSQGIIDSFYEGMKHRPQSTYGTFNDDILAYKDRSFRRGDFCSLILNSPWTSEGK